jgi:hypothetical protein
MFCLVGLSQLQWLSLSDAPVTDAGLEHVEGLTQLRWLQLDGTQVTDAGLEHLKRLVALDYVMLQRTQVPDPGPSVEKLRKALPNCTVNLELPPPDAPHTWAAPDQPGG